MKNITLSADEHLIELAREEARAIQKKYYHEHGTTLAGLMASARNGLLVTSMFGPSLNSNTGDWSVGCSGFWFENGEIAWPVTEVTVAGNLIDIWGRLVPGSDLEIRGAANAPSLLVDALAIAGK